MSVKQLTQLLQSQHIDTSTCVDKQDLVSLAQRALAQSHAGATGKGKVDEEGEGEEKAEKGKQETKLQF